MVRLKVTTVGSLAGVVKRTREVTEADPAWNWIGEHVALAAHEAMLAVFYGLAGIRDISAMLSVREQSPDNANATYNHVHDCSTGLSRLSAQT